MTIWFRTYHEDEDLWQYFEADDDGWVARQVEVKVTDTRPVTAASLAEVLRLRDHADAAAMRRYEQRFGLLAEGEVEGWRDRPLAIEVSVKEFEMVWVQARRELDGRGGRGG
ncbi:hypothetical protein ACIRL2_51085 [Embleya sp. NPDC127516]|uniref:hypothetical protein n=1 Tax=Embleya sp. NPDC127516 TaxID=3363990 RepID=UPI0037F584EF